MLDTYYLADVGLNRLPDAMDQLADLTVAGLVPSKDPDARVQQEIGLGTLIADLDSMDASLRASEAVDGGDRIMAKLDKPFFSLAKSLRRYAQALKTGGAKAGAARTLIEQTGAFFHEAAEELRLLLADRVALLHAARLRVLGLTTLLFAASAFLVLLSAVRGVTQPLQRSAAATTSAGTIEVLGSARRIAGQAEQIVTVVGDFIAGVRAA